MPPETDEFGVWADDPIDQPLPLLLRATVAVLCLIGAGAVVMGVVMGGPK